MRIASYVPGSPPSTDFIEKYAGFIQRVVNTKLKCGQKNKIKARYLFSKYKSTKDKFSKEKAVRLSCHEDMNYILRTLQASPQFTLFLKTDT